MNSNNQFPGGQFARSQSSNGSWHWPFEQATDLASTSLGRMVLHLLCVMRNPGRFRWHWNGILRELTW